MKSPSRINSPNIDIEAFFEGMIWDSEDEVNTNLAALTSGIGLLKESILGNLVNPEIVDFTLLTRTLQDSDPLFQVVKILEESMTTQTGGALRFKEVAADLRLLREILAGVVKYAPAEPAEEVRTSAFKTYIELLPKIHARFVDSKDALRRWKASVMLDQQVDFVARFVSDNEDIAEPEAIVKWGTDYLNAVSSNQGEGEEAKSGASEIGPILTDLKHYYLKLLQAEIKLEVEEFEKTIVLTEATHEHALSGFSELIFRARKEAEEGAKFNLTLDFEAVPIAEQVGDGPKVPVQPVHLKRAFETSYEKVEDIQKVVDGYVTSLQEDVDNGAFKDQDAKSLTGWFTDSIVPWVQSDDVTLVTT